jgi:polyisoprenoid-binding protein YceI
MLLVIGILVAGARAACAGEFVIRPGGENKVVFVSKAMMESIEGRTKQMEGRLVLDPANLGDTVSVHLEVDLASLDTGIGRRNKHMRENHLETAKYPRAVFDGISVHGPAGARLEPGKTATIDVEGTFTLHGVSRRLRIYAEATYEPKAGGGRIAFHATFPVALADYGISRPEFLFLKLSETQQVRVDGVAVAAP